MTPDLGPVKSYFQRILPNLSSQTWLEVEKCLEVRSFAKDEWIIQAGQVENYVCYLHSGLVRFVIRQDGKERITSFFSEDEMFSAYESFLQRQPTMYYIQALEPTVLICLNKKNVVELYDRFPEMDRFGRLIAEYLFIFITDMNNSLATMTPEERYIRLTKKSKQLLQRVPQYMIASYLGVTPEALSRIRKRIA